MYTAFYGLREKPFALSPDPRFLFLSQSHREALAHLLYGIDEGEGFIVITGEVGTGKTTLCRTLLQRLDPSTEVAFLFNPALTPHELLQAICVEFALGTGSGSRRELVDDLNAFLLEKNRDHRKALLIVDEAQNLSPETLEEVRLLSNLETETSKLIQILLLGQPELDAKLASPELRQLRQRITVRWRLGPMTAPETREYVVHRLRVAAGGDRPIFAERALGEVHRHSRGVPRVANMLCDRALLAGYASQAPQISAAMISEAAREVEASAVARAGAGPRRWRRLALGAGLALALLVVGALALRRSSESDLDLRAGARTDLGPVRVAVADDTLPRAGEVPLVAAPGPGIDPLGREVTPPAAASGGGDSLGASPEIDAAATLARLFEESTALISGAVSVDGLLEAFGLGSPSQPSAEDALAALRARGLHVLEVRHASLDELRVLNHPALLQIRAPGGAQRLVGLRNVEGELATLSGVGPGGSLGIPLTELEAYWDGEAYVVWRDFEALPYVLSLGESGPGVEWLQQALADLGYYESAPTGSFDEQTKLAVMTFQTLHELPVDGAVGPRTKMVLYDRLGRYEIPRLVRAKGVG